MYRIFIITAVWVLAQTTSATYSHAGVGDFYICHDVDDDEKFQSEFYMNWDNEYVHMQFLETDKIEGVETSDRILFQDDHSFVAINPDIEGGRSTFSFYEDVDGIISIRTFIESNRTFSRTSKCSLKQIAQTEPKPSANKPVKAK